VSAGAGRGGDGEALEPSSCILQPASVASPKVRTLPMPAAIKLSDEFVNLARGESRIMGRSIAGQVEHWARLGRAVERAPGFDYERIRSVLSARESFDDLAADEQAVALAELESYLEDLPRGGDASFFAALRAAGAPIHGETGRSADTSPVRRRRRVSRRRARGG
jgi:ParD-like antitoxin of type II bacterial toxin-antitoxin system